MAANTDAIPPQASREATDWLILLQEEPDDQDILQSRHGVMPTRPICRHGMQPAWQPM
jgi:ferric-dicitrate binding protein FerR (iron transport regulator)